MTGEAPCRCGWYNTRVALTGCVTPADDGGQWYECASGQVCGGGCGEVLAWLHVPAAEEMVWPTVAVEVNA